MVDIEKIERSKVFKAIVDVSFGGIRPFTDYDVSDYMGLPVRSIKKSIMKMKRKGIIEFIGFGLYAMSKDGMELEASKSKREKTFVFLRGTGKSLF